MNLRNPFSSKIRTPFDALITMATIAILLIAEGCASIGNPSGGPRDERPPRYVSATPAPGSKDIPVDIEKINITFDELVNVKDAFSKVIVSPPSKSVPRVSSLGRRVTVQFNDSLLPNTTYTIDFADAIEDNNEGNRLENFSYTFSTGPQIDSLRIAGHVLSARALEPMQLKLVGLHRLPDSLYNGTPADTIVPAEHPANYMQSVNAALFSQRFYRVARTDDRGRFSIEGLPAGRYRIYALDDANSDYLFTNPDEEVAFSDVIISPYAEQAVATDSIFDLRLERLDTVVERRRTLFFPNDVILRSFPTARKQQYIQKYERVDSTRLDLIFNAPMAAMPEMIVVGMPDAKGWAIAEHSPGNDTISLWLKSPALVATDTLRLALRYDVLDSVLNYTAKADTLRFTTDRTRLRAAAEKARKELEKKQKKEADKKKHDSEAQQDSAAAPPIALLKVDFISPATQDVNRPVIIETATPLASLDSTAIRLEMKTDTVWNPIARPRLIPDTLNPRRLAIEGPWEYDTQYRVTIDSLAMQGLYGLHNGSISREFTTKAEKAYCSLTMRLSDWPSGLPAFVELLSQQDAPLAIVPLENGVARFLHINPGKYYIRVTEDLNANGKWDSGDPVTGLLPEMAYYYPKAISIKQNWNKDETWQVFATPIDMMKPEILLKNKPTQTKANTRARKPNEDDDEEDF